MTTNRGNPFGRVMAAVGVAATLAVGGYAAENGDKAAAPALDPALDVPIAPTFDPKQAGWKLVFEDEFEGTEVDASKWYRPVFASKEPWIVKPDGEGHLVFHMKKDETGKLPNGYLYSVPEYAFGYFEARVKFTTKPGWWAASWIYGGSNQNPFLDGMEIDTVEDFYTRLKDGHMLKNHMAHTIHLHTGCHTSSRQRHTAVEGPVDDWHTIACKWDPFSLGFYLDGRLTGSFTAFNAGTCIRPLHAVLSTERRRQDMDTWMGGNAIPGAEEGTYEVDWVRIYRDEIAETEAPEVGWASDTDVKRVFAATGSVEELSVVATSRNTGDPIDHVYLFDNGYMLAHAAGDSGKFKVPLTAEYFDSTTYGVFLCGHSKKKPVFDAYPHVLVAFARTKSGRVGHSAPIYRIPAGEKPSSTPYGDAPSAIPGTIEAWKFDCGGQGCAYYRTPSRRPSKNAPKKNTGPRPDDLACSKWPIGKAGVTAVDGMSAGDWINYTVDVAKGGTYLATFRYGSSIRSANEAALLVDGRLAASFALPAGTETKRIPNLSSEAEVALEEGRHVVTVLFRSNLTFAGIDFKLKENKTR